MKLETIAAFGIGVALGGAISFLFCKKWADSEIEKAYEKMKADFQKPQVINYFQGKTKDSEKEEKTEEKPKVTKEEVNAYMKKVQDLGYSNYEDEDDPSDEEIEPVAYELNGDPDAIPVIIPPDEFGDEETYAQISLIYYTDGILADDTDHVFGNRTDIPRDFEDHFGEYEDDAVYVRNDRLRIYYEILRSLKSYEELLEQRPYLREENDDS